ncbi:DNA polymerase [Streptomyces platensis subsp. clarensis]|nr:DNA polymerase [Streptomyces platensis subsp. clarensis]
MREYHGSLNGQGWTGWLCERPEDLRPFMEWVSQQRDVVAFDTESQGLGIYHMGPDFLRLAQFGTATEAWVVPVELGPAFRAAATDALRILPKLVGHNVIGFDGLVVDKHLGVKLEEFCAKTTDTMITSKLLDPRGPEAGGIGASLKPQSAKYVDPSAPDTQEGLTALFKSLGYTKKSGLGWIHVPWNQPVYVVYSMLDVILASRLLVAHQADMKAKGVRPALVAYEHEISEMCAVMSRAGMLVDRPYTESLYGTLDAEREKHVAIAARYGVENVNSDRQIVEALLGMGEKWSDRTDGGNLSVDGSVLRRFADLTDKWEPIDSRTPNPLADAVLHAKRAGKWRSAYVDTFLETTDEHGYVHANINTLQARTGRMSITKPAVQTLPSGDQMIRRCLLADEGHVMVSTDFKAVEMRVLAALADVKRMKQAIADGRDLHDYTAELVYGPDFTPRHRKTCKGVGLSKIFGGGAETTSRQTGAPVEAVRSAMVTYDRVYPEIKRASNRWQREAFANGMVTVSRTGRRLPLDRDRTYAVVNYQCQSTARDVLGQAMRHMKQAGLLAYMKLPIHDEVLASVPKGEAMEFAREFERCMSFDLFGVPIEAEAEIGGRSWGSLYGADF